jgi:chromosome segregation ATPase
LRSQSSRPVLEQKRANVKEFVKESQSQIQNSKDLLTELQPALELKIARKAALEAELKTLTAEIEADRKKIAELPGLIEKIQKDTSAAMIESNQLKAKLSTLSNAQETYQKLLENINQMTSNASSVIAKYLNIWLCQAICSRTIGRLCNFVFYKLHFPFSVSPCSQA